MCTVPCAVPPSAAARSASVSESKSSWTAMNDGPRTFQCACFTWPRRSIAAARCLLSSSMDCARMFAESALYVCCMVKSPKQVKYAEAVNLEVEVDAIELDLPAELQPHGVVEAGVPRSECSVGAERDDRKNRRP